VTTILVVDDAPELRDIMTIVLMDEGFEVSACGRADEALTRLACSLPDLLILDGRLPGMSGWQCLKLLRASDRTAKLPVLLVTAAIDDLERGEQEPTDDCTTFVAKPFDIDDLLAAIHKVIATCHRNSVAA
jgi:two-component system phosphate regulon response regulator PhoB